MEVEDVLPTRRPVRLGQVEPLGVELLVQELSDAFAITMTAAASASGMSQMSMACVLGTTIV